MKNLQLILATTVALSLTPSVIAQQIVWTGSWAAAPMAAPAASTPSNPNGTFYRDNVHLSLGGKTIRLRISNEFGTTPLVVSAVDVGIADGATGIQPDTNTLALFGGVGEVTIPAGSVAVSDPVALAVPPFANLAVTILVPPQPSATLTWHPFAASTNYVTPAVSAPHIAQPSDGKAVSSWYLLKAVDVDAGPRAAAIVALGASIVDGYHSTPDKNLRWPDDLARRLQAYAATAHIGVLNEGISGARILHDGTGPSALARLDRDVLAQTGARYVIIALGTNDIGRTFFPRIANEAPINEGQLEWALQQIVARAHARGVRVIATTLNPYEGADFYNVPGDQMRQAFNTYVRTSGIFDGVIDFDRVMRDPAHPLRFLPAYDSGDHLHPNDTGYKAMAGSIDLKLFTK